MGNQFRASLLLIVVAFCSVLTAQDKYSKSSGGSAAGSEPAAVLKTTTRMVVLDVIATDNQGNPVTDLKADDFTVLEKDQKQQIKSFEFQQPFRMAADLSVTPVALKLPPNVFTNNQFVDAPKTMNVLLLDTLNTNMPNQMYVRQQMLRFVETMPSGQPVAVYALNRQLRLVQDFTTDTGVLREIAKNFHAERSAVPENATGGGTDPLLSPGALTGNPSAATLLEMLQMSQAEQSHYDFCTRFATTVRALQTFAGTLAGYSGRKNIIWVSENFPLRFFRDDGQVGSECPFDSKVMLEKAANTLADAHIAVYPVDAAGLIVNGMNATSSGYDEFGRSQTGGEAYGSLLRQQFTSSADNHYNMDNIAKQTGGRAFYNRNDLGSAIQSGMTDGSTYYMLGYYPSDRNWNGEFRNVEVKVSRPGVNLRYRPGYYAIDWTNYAKDAKARESEVDEALAVSKPLSTAIFFTAAVTLPSKQTSGKMLVKYDVDARSILFEPGDDGLQHADVTCWVRAFDEKGHPLKATSQTTAASLKLDTYQRIMRTAFPCSAELELPAGKYQLRFAVRDERTGKMGTANGKVTIPERGRVEEASYSPPEIELAKGEVVLPVFAEQQSPPKLEGATLPERATVQQSRTSDVPKLETMTVSEYCRSVANGMEQADALTSACEFALIVQQKFPNYICDAKVTRRDSLGGLNDVTDLQVRVEDGKDSYSNVRTNVKGNGNSGETPPIWSSGEFGMLLTALFLPENKASFKLVKQERLDSRPALLFNFQIREEDNKSFYVWNLYGQKSTPGYRGSIWLEKTTHRLLQVKLFSARVPSSVIERMEATIGYGEVPLSDGTVFPLPIRASMKALTFRNTGLLLRENWIRNNVEFSNCHKFRAKAKIVAEE